MPRKHIRNVSRNNATWKQFRCLEIAALNKTEWTKFSENKENKTIHLPPDRAQLTGCKQFYRAFLPRFKIRVSSSVPCPLNRTWDGSHTFENFNVWATISWATIWHTGMNVSRMQRYKGYYHTQSIYWIAGYERKMADELTETLSEGKSIHLQHNTCTLNCAIWSFCP